MCGASDSNNGSLSDLLSQICMQLGDEMDESIGTLCISQEEMCGGMEKVNNMVGIKKLVVLSMDVSKMFPSLVASDVAEVVKEEYQHSGRTLMEQAFSSTRYIIDHTMKEMLNSPR